MADWNKHRLVCEDAQGGRKFSIASLISVAEEDDSISPISRVTSWKTAHSQSHSRGSSGDWRRASLAIGAHITYDKNIPPSVNAKIDPNTIYYIKTIKPNLHNVMICGPYYPISVVRSQMVRRLLKYSHTAYATFVRAFPDALEGEEPASLAHWRQIRGPLNDNPFEDIVLELVCEQNETIAKALPCPSYKVLSLKHKQLGGNKTDRFSDTFDFSPLEDIEVHGSVLTKEEAEIKAQDIIQQKMEQYGPDCREMSGWEGSSFMSFITKKRDVVATVEAAYDEGGVGSCSGTTAESSQTEACPMPVIQVGNVGIMERNLRRPSVMVTRF